jgi:hypothetical protein
MVRIPQGFGLTLHPMGFEVFSATAVGTGFGHGVHFGLYFGQANSDAHGFPSCGECTPFPGIEQSQREAGNVMRENVKHET